MEGGEGSGLTLELLEPPFQLVIVVRHLPSVCGRQPPGDAGGPGQFHYSWRAAPAGCTLQITPGPPAAPMHRGPQAKPMGLSEPEGGAASCEQAGCRGVRRSPDTTQHGNPGVALGGGGGGGGGDAGNPGGPRTQGEEAAGTAALAKSTFPSPVVSNMANPQRGAAAGPGRELAAAHTPPPSARGGRRLVIEPRAARGARVMSPD